MSTDTHAQQVTPDELADKCEAWLQSGGASNIVDAYEAGYRAALAASPQPTAAHDQAAINELVAQELERIAEEPPINGNRLAQARVQMAARGLRGASAAPTQPTQESKNAHNDDPAYSTNQVAGLLADLHAAYGHSQQQFVDSQAAVVELAEALRVLLECREYGPVSETADAWQQARAALSRAPGAGMLNAADKPTTEARSAVVGRP